jgi:hypothetical protein
MTTPSTPIKIKLHLWSNGWPEPKKGSEVSKQTLTKIVLEMFFENDGLTAYDIRKNLKYTPLKREIPHSTLMGIIKQLENDKQVQVAKTEPFRNTGMSKSFYDVTFRGARFLLKPWSVEEQLRIDRKFAMETLLKKDYLHPFLKKLKEWRLTETPELEKAIVFSKDSGFLDYFRGPENDCKISVEDMTEATINLLVGYIFRSEFPQLNDEEKACPPFLQEYRDLAENPPPEQEVILLLKNNSWIKPKMKEFLDCCQRQLEYSYSSFVDAYSKHKTFFDGTSDLS